MAAASGRTFIGMGSNLGDSAATLIEAWEMIGDLDGVRLVALSSPYVSAPVDMQSSHWFTNAVGELAITCSPAQLLTALLTVESSLGRIREQGQFGYQDRPIDLDLLYVGDTVLNTPELILPHPHLYDRLFVLLPLVEIAPDFVDCRRDRTMTELTQRLQARITDGLLRPQEISRTDWPDGEPWRG